MTIEKMEELKKDFPPQTSERYRFLESVFHKALQKSESDFDIETAMSQIYSPEDVKSLGGEGTLRIFFEAGLNKIRQKLLTSMVEYCRQQQIPDDLLKLETIILKLEREAAWERYMEEQDFLSAQKALERAQMPINYRPENLILYQMQKQLSAQQTSLEEQLAQVQAEIAQLEQEEHKMAQIVRHEQENVAKLNLEMEKAADLTADISK